MGYLRGRPISSGEDSLSALLREVKEEIGADLDASQLELIGTIRKQTILNNETYFDNEFNDVYLARLDLAIDELDRQVSEVKALQWVPIIEFKKWVQEKKIDLVPHAEEYELLFKRLTDYLK